MRRQSGHNTGPCAQLPPSFLGIDAWITSHINIATIRPWVNDVYCKTHYYRAPNNFTHFAQGNDSAYITGADIHSK